ncbi:MAG: hypothetical protein KDA25_03380 [Phycisphaerales bacterium]|nr:hypothetical protein [Phycisphaerales bacterium]
MMSFVLVSLVLVAAPVRADDVVVESRIVSVGLFKNGVAAVRREVTLPGPGSFALDDVPEPVHGSYWVESPARIESRVTTRMVDLTLGPTAGDLRQDLVGRRVNLRLRGDAFATVSGTAVGIVRPAEATGAGFVVIDAATGRQYLDLDEVVAIEVVTWVPGVRTVAQPVLILDVAPGAGEGPFVAWITYLTHGAAWAAGYHVDLTDPDTLTITQQATIRNEFVDLTDVDIDLISGFPNIEFAHVRSPMAASTSLAQFFAELSQRMNDPGGVLGNNDVLTQQLATYAGGTSGPAGPTAPEVDGRADIHHQSAGRRTLKRGDTVTFDVATAAAAYEHIVEWIIPDTRRPDGRFIDEYERQRDPEAYRDVAWDAIRFRNPLPFPMTTGVATIRAAGRFLGQRMSSWSNPGESVTLHVTKALSVRTRHAEQEEPGERRIVFIGGNDFREIDVRGEVLVCNHRATPVRIVIRRRFSGDLIEAEGDPVESLREDGVYSINRRAELTWTIELPPDSERTLTYRYTVLVDH